MVALAAVLFDPTMEGRKGRGQYQPAKMLTGRRPVNCVHHYLPPKRRSDVLL